MGKNGQIIGKIRKIDYFYIHFRCFNCDFEQIYSIRVTKVLPNRKDQLIRLARSSLKKARVLGKMEPIIEKAQVLIKVLVVEMEVNNDYYWRFKSSQKY